MMTEIDNAIAFLVAHKPENNSSSPGETKNVAEILEEIKKVQEKSEEEASEKLKENLEQFASAYLPSLQKRKAELEEVYELNRVIKNTQQEADGKIKILEGFVPRPEKKSFPNFSTAKELCISKTAHAFLITLPYCCTTTGSAVCLNRLEVCSHCRLTKI